MAKPMLTMAKKKHQQKKFTLFNGFFIAFGRKYHRIQNWINMRIIKSTKQKQHKQLKQQVALEKGIQGLYQIFFYMIVIGLPLYEMNKASISSHTKQEKLNNQITALQKNLQDISSKLDQLVPKRIHLPIYLPAKSELISTKFVSSSDKPNQLQKDIKQVSNGTKQSLKGQKQGKQQYSVMSEASEIISQTIKDQIQDSILQTISDFIQQAVMEAAQAAMD